MNRSPQPQLNATIPKDYEIPNITLEQAVGWLEEKAAKKGVKRAKKKTTKKAAKKKSAKKKAPAKKAAAKKKAKTAAKKSGANQPD